MHNYNQEQAVEPASASGRHQCLSHAHPALMGTMGTLVPGGEGRAGIPNQTAMHRATLLALNRKNMTELAKEKTCRAGNSARKAPTGKAKLTMRWRHYRKFRFSQNNFPKGEAQKFTYSIILRYFTLSHLQEQLSVCCPEPAVETLKMKSTLDGTSATRLSLEKFASGKQTVLKKPG